MITGHLIVRAREYAKLLYKAGYVGDRTDMLLARKLAAETFKIPVAELGSINTLFGYSQIRLVQ